VLAILPLLAVSLTRMAERLRDRESGWSLDRLQTLGSSACLLILMVSLVEPVLPWARFPVGFGVRRNVFPQGAAAFLERHHLDGRVFNAYHFGGYLIWRRWPANLVIIDGRYDAILFDEALLESYRQAHVSRQAFDLLATTYGIEVCVVDVRPGNRVGHLGAHPDWARVYWDQTAEVFVRRDGRFAALAAAREYQLTRAGDDSQYLMAYRGLRQMWERAVAELRRAVEDNPENSMAWLGLAQEYRAAGPGAAGERLEALRQAEALLPGSPATGRILAEQAEALLHLGRLAEAEAAARRALWVQEDQLLSRSVLAAVAETRGEWPQAREQLQAILDRLPPGDPRIPGVRERLTAAERGLGNRTPSPR
jgi:hypothetical protein